MTKKSDSPQRWQQALERHRQELSEKQGDSRLADRLAELLGELMAAAVPVEPESAARPALPESDAAMRAAIAHTFIIGRPASCGATQAASHEEIVPADEQESSAILANSGVVMIAGKRRLRLTDEARGQLLNRVHRSDRFRALLKEAAEADRRDFREIESDEIRLPTAWLRSFLEGTSGDLNKAPARELRAAVEALERLKDVRMEGLPVSSLKDARRLLELGELLEPLRILVGTTGGWDGTPQKDRFVGRSEEIGRLRRFVDELKSHTVSEAVQRFVGRTYKGARYLFGVRDESVFFIRARGGLGKSTLVAKFMLDHARGQTSPFPFAYLDFDRAALQPREPRQLLVETARQVALQFPEVSDNLAALGTRLSDELAGRAAGTSSDGFEEFRELVQRRITGRSRAFLVVLDTMEVVQYDPKSLAGVVTFVSNLSGNEAGASFPELKIVAAGRADVPELRTRPELRSEERHLILQPLSPDEARDMANRVGRDILGRDWRSEWAALIVGSEEDAPERQEPLTIRVAVELLRGAEPARRAALAEEIALKGEDADGDFVGRLYEKRVLEHVNEEDVRKLAWPGLVVRRVTREIIREKLAVLCGLEPDRTDHVFEALANEVWLVEDYGDVLRHRPDLRARTLPLMRRSNRQLFDRVNEAAKSYYAERQTDSSDYAEWLYHRLLGGEDPERVDLDWRDSMATLLAGAADDFAHDSMARSYLLARTAMDLLPPDIIQRLSPRLALDHVARTAAHLGAFDDTKIEPILADLSVRANAADVASSGPHPIKGIVLIKTGRWAVDAPIEGGEGSWVAHGLFARRFKRARTAATRQYGKGATKNAPASDALQLDWAGPDEPVRCIVQDMAYARILGNPIAHELDQRLAAMLERFTPEHGFTDLAALRTAVVFGWKSSVPAARAWMRMQNSPTTSNAVPTLSLMELRALLETDKRIRRLLQDEMKPVLEELNLQWSDVARLAGRGRRQRMRIAHTRLRQVLATVLDAMLQNPAPEMLNSVRDFFAGRDEDWIVPIGYAASRAVGSQKSGLLLERRFGTYEPERAGLLRKRRPQLAVPDDMLQLIRQADEAADLTGAAEIIAKTAESGESARDLRLLLNHHATWREQVKAVLDASDSESTASDVPLPPPGPIRHADDPQKERWGGRAERDGRKLEAVLVDAQKEEFLVNLIVRSTNGSALEGPVVFHLHDTFPRKIIRIRKIRDGIWAMLEEVSTYGVFTVGVQVKTREGQWTSLELDLATLNSQRLPKRFLSR